MTKEVIDAHLLKLGSGRCFYNTVHRNSLKIIRELMKELEGKNERVIELQGS